MNSGGRTAKAKPRNRKMSNFRISDITPASVYISAMNTAANSDYRNAGRGVAVRERQDILKRLGILVWCAVSRNGNSHSSGGGIRAQASPNAAGQ